MYLVHLPRHRLAYSGGTQVELWTPDRTTCISNCRANNSSSTSRPLPHKRPRPPLCPRYVATTIDPLYASSFSRYIACFSILYDYILSFFHPLCHIHIYVLVCVCARVCVRACVRVCTHIYIFFLLFARDSFVYLKKKKSILWSLNISYQSLSRY